MSERLVQLDTEGNPYVWSEDNKPYCPDCNSVGMSHCAHPEECGGVIYPAPRIK